MKNAILFMLIALLFASNGAYAADAAKCDNVTRVHVDGLVCDFCARALEKVFGARAEVSSIHVNLDDGLVTIMTKPDQQVDDDMLRKLITDSGYNVRDIERGCAA